jgi:hypothetical protein
MAHQAPFCGQTKPSERLGGKQTEDGASLDKRSVAVGKLATGTFEAAGLTHFLGIVQFRVKGTVYLEDTLTGWKIHAKNRYLSCT